MIARHLAEARRILRFRGRRRTSAKSRKSHGRPRHPRPTITAAQARRPHHPPARPHASQMSPFPRTGIVFTVRDEPRDLVPPRGRRRRAAPRWRRVQADGPRSPRPRRSRPASRKRDVLVVDARRGTSSSPAPRPHCRRPRGRACARGSASPGWPRRRPCSSPCGRDNRSSCRDGRRVPRRRAARVASPSEFGSTP